MMISQALDLILGKMKNAGFDFSRVKALSGSGQVCGLLLVLYYSAPLCILNTVRHYMYCISSLPCFYSNMAVCIGGKGPTKFSGISSQEKVCMNF